MSSSPSFFQVPNLSPVLRSYNPVCSSLKSNKEKRGGGARKRKRERGTRAEGEKKAGEEGAGGRQAGREGAMGGESTCSNGATRLGSGARARSLRFAEVSGHGNFPAATSASVAGWYLWWGASCVRGGGDSSGALFFPSCTSPSPPPPAIVCCWECDISVDHLYCSLSKRGGWVGAKCNTMSTEGEKETSCGRTEHDSSILSMCFFIARGSNHWVYSVGLVFVSARTNKTHYSLPHRKCSRDSLNP